MRAIAFLLLVILVFFVVRYTLNRVIEIREKNRQQEQKAQTDTPEKEAQSMVRCAHCGVHLPQSEAYYDGKHTFCSEGHMQAYHKKERESSNSDFRSDELDGD